MMRQCSSYRLFTGQYVTIAYTTKLWVTYFRPQTDPQPDAMIHAGERAYKLSIYIVNIVV